MLQFYLNKMFQFLNYDIYSPISFIFLTILTLIYFLKIEENKKIGIYFLIFILANLVFIFWSAFLSLNQYLLWQKHEISKYLLPPYQKINYFLSYAYFHFWRDFFYRILGIFLIFISFKFLNFTFKRDIFYDEEKILVPILALFYFFPYNLLFLFLGFFMLLLLIMMNLLRKKIGPEERLSFKNYWLFLAWLIFVFQPLFLTNYELLKWKP